MSRLQPPQRLLWLRPRTLRCLRLASRTQRAVASGPSLTPESEPQQVWPWDTLFGASPNP
jgi:hypothetical protein